MSHESQTMTFALSAAGRVVHIDEVANGLASQCACPHCGGKLVARQGPVRNHHFCHHQSAEAAGCVETALHKAAKEILLREMCVSLPAQLDGMGSRLGTEARFETVALEYRLGCAETGTEIVADAFGRGMKDVIVEIAVSHRVDPEKVEKIRRLDLSAIEIDLADALNEHWDWESLRQAVILDPLRRVWINLPEPQPIQVHDVGLPTWRFRIQGSTVVARKLPFSNVSIWHPIHQRVRAIVEAACRGRGRWDGKYNNWIVFDRFWPEVYAALQAASAAFVSGDQARSSSK